MEMAIIISMCRLLESILDKQDVKALEYLFVFASVWCIGGGFSEKDGKDFRKEFSNWWKEKWKTVKFPSKGTVFDYFVDIENSKLEEWNKMTTKEVDPDTSRPISSYTIPTMDTMSANYLMKQFISVEHSPMLIGPAGCGKTQITMGLLNELTTTTDQYIMQIVNFNFYTDSMLL
jgi:dynein heavy chain